MWSTSLAVPNTWVSARVWQICDMPPDDPFDSATLSCLWKRGEKLTSSPSITKVPVVRYSQNQANQA